jgi:hypothetical protein
MNVEGELLGKRGETEGEERTREGKGGDYDQSMLYAHMKMSQ